MVHSLRFLRLASLGAVAFSTAAALDRYGRADTFCGPGGGCAAVAASDLGHMLGGLLPGLGLGAYTAIFIASLSRMVALRQLALWASVAGGLGGLLLLGLQGYLIGAFCTVCVGVDLSAVATAALAVAALRAESAAESSWPLTAWAALYVIAAGALPAYAMSRPEPVPPEVRALHEEGRINVVEFSDFECPYCRGMHPVLAEAMAPYGERIHFVRLAYPLRAHRFASASARAYLCGKQQDRGEAMADALFTGDKLDPDGLRATAEKVGLDPVAFDRCMRDEETAKEVGRQRALVAAAGMRGLPTVWIGERVIVGFDRNKGQGPYAEALRATAEGDHPTYAAWPWLVVGAIALLFVSLAARKIRRRHAEGS